MNDRKVTIMLTKLYCKHSTGEAGHDEVYFKTWVDGSYMGTYPKGAWDGDCFQMNSSNDSMRYCDMNLTLTMGQTVKMQLREQDNKNNPDHDEVIGTKDVKISEILLSGSGIYKTTFNDYKDACYELTWRVVSHKVPTLRLLALSCQQTSCNCDKDLAKTLSSIVEEVLGATATILGETEIPQAEEISLALDIAAASVQAVTALAVWMADAIEGSDDVYLQHANDGQQVQDSVGILPDDGSVMKFDEGTKIYFMEKFGKYCRVPLDMGDVTIEAREKDQMQHDVSLGAFTVGMLDYNQYISKGAMVRPLDNYLDNQDGQGAVYHICYSFAYEDWTLPPNGDQ